MKMMKTANSPNKQISRANFVPYANLLVLCKHLNVFLNKQLKRYSRKSLAHIMCTMFINKTTLVKVFIMARY